jgi:hypothetical protein
MDTKSPCFDVSFADSSWTPGGLSRISDTEIFGNIRCVLAPSTCLLLCFLQLNYLFHVVVDAVAVMTSMARFARVMEMPAGGLIHLVNALLCRHDGFCREDGAEQQLR